MATGTKPYKLTNKDTAAIVALGYCLHGINQEVFSGFIQKNYPGFNLAHLLQEVEQLMVPHAQPPITRLIGVDGNSLQVRLENNFKGEDDALIFDRIFYKESGILKVKHEYLIFPVTARNQGLAKKVLKASLEQYLKMGIETIEVDAGLSAGAYVWARHGFTAVNPEDMKRILKRVRQQLTKEQYDIVEKIYSHYYKKNPAGNAFPHSALGKPAVYATSINGSKKPMARQAEFEK
jgi:hypothetical protein